MEALKINELTSTLPLGDRWLLRGAFAQDALEGKQGEQRLPRSASAYIDYMDNRKLPIPRTPRASYVFLSSPPCRLPPVHCAIFSAGFTPNDTNQKICQNRPKKRQNGRPRQEWQAQTGNRQSYDFISWLSDAEQIGGLAGYALGTWRMS